MSWLTSELSLWLSGRGCDAVAPPQTLLHTILKCGRGLWQHDEIYFIHFFFGQNCHFKLKFLTHSSKNSDFHLEFFFFFFFRSAGTGSWNSKRILRKIFILGKRENDFIVFLLNLKSRILSSDKKNPGFRIPTQKVGGTPVMPIWVPDPRWLLRTSSNSCASHGLLAAYVFVSLRYQQLVCC